MLPLKLGALGLAIECILIGESRYYRADISYLIAYRFIQDIRESLVPFLLQHSILGWAVAIERFLPELASRFSEFQGLEGNSIPGRK